MARARGTRFLLIAAILVITSACTTSRSKTEDLPVRKSPEFEFSIPRAPVTTALHVWSHQSGLHFGFFPKTPMEEDLLVGPVEGRFAAEEALRRLISGAGFSFEWVLEGKGVRVSYRDDLRAPQP